METSIQPRIISVHVPKTAGSSLHAQLSQHFGDKLALDITHDPFTVAGQERGCFPQDKIVLHGHFAARRYETEQACWITFLRNPVDNLISIYFYWKSISKPAQHIHQRFLTEQPDIRDLARYKELRRLFSETYFGGFDMQRFAFIGFYERRERDILRLGTLLNLPLRAEVHVNLSGLTDERLATTHNTKLRGELASILSHDMKFYERHLQKHSL